jgi:hypothetical protein
MENLKTWNEVRNMVHDISGIDNPFDYLYSNEITNTKVWYPVVKGGYQDIHKFNKGSVYSREEILNYSYNVNLMFDEIFDSNGSRNYSSGHNFIKLVERSNSKVITFILNKDYQFECVYNDFE